MRNPIATPQLLGSLIGLLLIAASGPARAFDELHLEWDFFVRGGGVLVDSVGLAVRAGGPSSGIVTVDDLPKRAAITQAFLYWMTIGGTGDDTAELDGVPITGVEVGTCEDTCWSIGPNYVYRADVSSIVTMPGDYEVSGVGVGDGSSPDGQGATVLAFYDDPSAESAGFIKIYEGARDNMPGPNEVEATYTTFSGLFLPVAPIRAQMTWSVGDAQAFSDGQTTFEGAVLDTDNFEPTEDGPLWDTDEWDVLPYLSVGMTEVTAGISVGGGMDCLAIGLAILEYDLPCTYDGDGDGSGVCEDCDDDNPDLNSIDNDGDGRSSCTGDCDDTEPQVYEGHPEICDGLDNDCDGTVPTDETDDGDADGWIACADCDDSDWTVNPEADEVCENGIDDNCDGQVDEVDCGDDDDDDAATDDDDDAATDDDDDDDGGSIRPAGCSCASVELDGGGGRPAAALGLFLLVLVGIGRRRRS